VALPGGGGGCGLGRGVTRASKKASSPFFEKKGPKKLFLTRLALRIQRTPNGQKFFASFFQKRRFFLARASLC
jgi:hypothetical protein